MVVFGRIGGRRNWQRPLPLTNDIVIEIKAAPAHSDRLQSAMAHFPEARSRNSKYIRGVAASL